MVVEGSPRLSNGKYNRCRKRQVEKRFRSLSGESKDNFYGADGAEGPAAGRLISPSRLGRYSLRIFSFSCGLARAASCMYLTTLSGSLAFANSAARLWQ